LEDSLSSERNNSNIEFLRGGFYRPPLLRTLNTLMEFSFTPKRVAAFVLLLVVLFGGYIGFIKFPAIMFALNKENIETDTISELPDLIQKDIERLQHGPEEPVEEEKDTNPEEDMQASEELSVQELTNRLIIPKIGVNAEIHEYPNLDILNQKEGVWREPISSDLSRGNNMVIAGHRWQYLPPNMATFYLLPELVDGDEIFVFWEGETHRYLVNDSYETVRTDAGVFRDTEIPTVTLYTCTPLETGVNRHIITAQIAE